MSSHINPKWFALINDISISAPSQVVKVEVLKSQGLVPHDHVIVRDSNEPHDTVLKDSDLIDLAEGNVFYSRLHDEVKPSGTCPTGPVKLAFSVNDAFEVTIVPEQTRDSLLGLFSIEGTVQLFRDFESPNDQPIGDGSVIYFKDGPVFYTRGGHSHAPHVEITVDGVKHKVAAGKTSVAEIKRIGNVPLADELVQNIACKLTPLADDATVCIVGGEEFVSHPRCGASS
jgi:hypothetical protein